MSSLKHLHPPPVSKLLPCLFYVVDTKLGAGAAEIDDGLCYEEIPPLAAAPELLLTVVLRHRHRLQLRRRARRPLPQELPALCG